MEWRPTEYLLEGELKNTTPGKVTGWLRFAGMSERVVFDLRGDFHRDIRGTTLLLKGPGSQKDPKAHKKMDGFARRQIGYVSDITAQRVPRNAFDSHYIEWYSQNGLVGLALQAEELKVVGKPMSPEELEEESARHAERRFTHWIRVLGRIVGEAREAEEIGDGDLSQAFVRPFYGLEVPEYQCIPSSLLEPKSKTAKRTAELQGNAGTPKR